MLAAGDAGDKLLSGSGEDLFDCGLKLHAGGNDAVEMALLRLCGDACALTALPRGTKLKDLDPGCGV